MTPEHTLGFGHFIAQADVVGKTLLGILVVMSAASWYLIVMKGITQFVRKHRSAHFLNFFWNASSWRPSHRQPRLNPRS